MKKRLAVLLGAGALTMAALCGCGATKEQIVDKMFDEQAESYVMNAEVEADVSLGMSGMNIDAGFSGSIESEIDNSDEDAPAIHMNLDGKATAMGSSQKFSTESYVITGDDGVTSYVKDPDSGDWSYTTAEVDENPLDKETRDKLIEEVKDVMKENGELQKKTEKKEGEDCYVLKFNTTFDSFEGVIDVIWDAAGEEVTSELEDADVDKKTILKYLSYFNVDATFYASKKNGYLVAADMSLADSDVDGLLKQAQKDFGSMTSGMGVDLSSISIEISELSMSFTFSEWGDVEVELPKDVKNNATDLNLGNILDGDGMIGGGDDWDDGDDDDDDDDDDGDDGDDIDVNTPIDTDEEEGVKINSDGTVTLYDWMDINVADIAPLKGYELQKDYSTNSSLMYSDGSWSYYYVGTTGWAEWEDVMKNGEKVTDDGYDYYVVMDGTNCKMVMDLGVKYDGHPVIAAVEGEYDEDASDFTYATYYITFEYGDGSWCQVMLDSSKVADWEPEDYIDAFDKIFQ